jgi:hypothetical protein
VFVLNTDFVKAPTVPVRAAALFSRHYGFATSQSRFAVSKIKAINPKNRLFVRA